MSDSMMTRDDLHRRECLIGAAPELLQAIYAFMDAGYGNMTDYSKQAQASAMASIAIIRAEGRFEEMQQMKPMNDAALDTKLVSLEKSNNYDPRHYHFQRYCEGYYPEPDALPGDKFIAWTLSCLCSLLVIAGVIYGVSV